MNRSCAVPGCPRFAVPGRRGRCAAHVRGTAERGYDRTHAQARSDLEQTLPALCAYGCGTILRRGQPWVAAHAVDGDPSAGWVASCLTCNQRAKGGQLRPTASAVLVGAR